MGSAPSAAPQVEGGSRAPALRFYPAAKQREEEGTLQHRDLWEVHAPPRALLEPADDQRVFPGQTPEAACCSAAAPRVACFQRWLAIRQHCSTGEEQWQRRESWRLEDGPLFGDVAHKILYRPFATEIPKMDPGRRVLTFTYLAESFQPLMFELAEYLADVPRDIEHLQMLSASLFPVGSTGALLVLWQQMLAARWPAFYDCLAYRGVRAWRDAYRMILSGQLEVTLEIYDREKKPGFAMAAMAARVQYVRKEGGYVAKYLSASEVLPEVISECEEYRLRFCPAAVRDALRPGHPLPETSQSDERPNVQSAAEAASAYPYRVLEGVDGLEVGSGVELQWKMQLGSPFGWWYGHLEALVHDEERKCATATITFRHFPPASRWYRLQVYFGDSQMRPCSFGGYTGGIRGVNAAERRHWMQFFPQDPVLF